MGLVWDNTYPISKAAQFRLQQSYDALRLSDRARGVVIHVRGVNPAQWRNQTGGDITRSDASWYDQSEYILSRLDGNGRVQDESWSQHEYFHAISDGLFGLDTWQVIADFCAKHWADMPSDYARKYRTKLWDENEQPARGLREAWAEMAAATLGTILHPGLHAPKPVIKQFVAQIMARF